jgi:hypothetical protein
MRPKYPPAQYFDMARQIREIADAIAELDTRAMVEQIADDYERMGRDAGGAVIDAVTRSEETV